MNLVSFLFRNTPQGPSSDVPSPLNNSEGGQARAPTPESGNDSKLETEDVFTHSPSRQKARMPVLPGHPAEENQASRPNQISAALPKATDSKPVGPPIFKLPPDWKDITVRKEALPLTVASLQAWVEAPELSGKQLAARQEISRRILASRNFLSRLFPSLPIVLFFDLDLRGCPDVTELPDGLHIGGTLYIDGCRDLKQLPDHLRVTTKISARNCTGLTSLPHTLKSIDELDVTGCTGLLRLPDYLTVNFVAAIDGCTSIKYLPRNFWVRGPLGLTDCTALLSIPGDLKAESLNVSGCVNLTHIEEGLTVNDLYLDDCVRFVRFPSVLHVSGNLSIYGCIALSEFPSGVTFNGMLSTVKCERLNFLRESDNLLPKNIALQTLLQAQRQRESISLCGLLLSQEFDELLLRVAQEERLSVLKIMQRFSPCIREDRNLFARISKNIIWLPQEERTEVADLCEPLMRLTDGRVNPFFGEMFTHLCLTSAELRPTQALILLDAVAAMSRISGTDVHEGKRDFFARSAAAKLWHGTGAAARNISIPATLDEIGADIERLESSTKPLPAYLRERDEEGQTHFQRARLTLKALRESPGKFVLDVSTRQEVSLAALVAMAYNLGKGIREGGDEETQARRDELRRLYIAALSYSLLDRSGELYCSQGVVQYILTPLQGYFPEVRLDAFEPPSEGAFVSEFARDLDRALESVLLDRDRKALVRREVDVAKKRAEAVYAPLLDELSEVEKATAREAAAIRIDRVHKDIDRYLELADLL